MALEYPPFRAKLHSTIIMDFLTRMVLMDKQQSTTSLNSSTQDSINSSTCRLKAIIRMHSPNRFYQLQLTRMGWILHLRMQALQSSPFLQGIKALKLTSHLILVVMRVEQLRTEVRILSGRAQDKNPMKLWFTTSTRQLFHSSHKNYISKMCLTSARISFQESKSSRF